MGGRVKQAVAFKLTMNFHQGVADAAQQPDADRFVIEKGAGAAIGGDYPAQHQMICKG